MTRSEPWFHDFWYVHHLGFLCLFWCIWTWPCWERGQASASSLKLGTGGHQPTGWTGASTPTRGIRPTSMAVRSNEPRGSLKPNDREFLCKKMPFAILPCTERITQEAFLGTSFATWKGGMDSWTDGVSKHLLLDVNPRKFAWHCFTHAPLTSRHPIGT